MLAYFMLQQGFCIDEKNLCRVLNQLLFILPLKKKRMYDLLIFFIAKKGDFVKMKRYLEKKMVQCMGIYMNILFYLSVIDCDTLKSWPHDHKLRKNLSLKLNSLYLEFYLTQCINDLQIWIIFTFQHNITFLVHYQKHFKSYQLEMLT